jgi:hypothetical protein
VARARQNQKDVEGSSCVSSGSDTGTPSACFLRVSAVVTICFSCAPRLVYAWIPVQLNRNFKRYSAQTYQLLLQDLQSRGLPCRGMQCRREAKSVPEKTSWDRRIRDLMQFIAL